MSHENKDIMNPAMSQINDQLNEMSAEEFRRSFYSWFEDHGLVAELRKHLRHQMVDSLRNTNLGVAVSQMHLTGSLKTQLINLLIAEYLVNMNYLLSLSVYSTEVPFISIFPECKSWLNRRESTNVTQRYFSEPKVLEILELLGFSRESEICKRTIDTYFNDEENNSVITCLIRLLSDLTKEKPNKSLQDTNIAPLNYEFLMTLEPWLKEIYSLLSNFEIPSDILCDILSHLRSIFLREQEKIKLTETTNFNLLQSQIQKDLQKRELEISKIITDLEQTFFQEKQQMIQEFAKEQSQVSTTIESALKREAEYKKKLHVLERREEVIQERETEVTDQMETLKNRIKLLQDAYDSVIAENIKLGGIRSQHEGDGLRHDNESRELLRIEYEYLRKEIKATKDALQAFNKSLSNKRQKREQSKEPQELMTKLMIERLQNDNSQLIDTNRLLQQKLDELTTRNNGLMSELDNALRTADVLINQQNNPRAMTANQLSNMNSGLQQEVADLTNTNNQLMRELEDNLQTVNNLMAQTNGPPRTTITLTTPRLPPAPPTSMAPTPAPRHISAGAGENLPVTTQPRFQIRNVAQNSAEYRRTVPSRLIVHNSRASETSSSTPTDEVLQEARTRLRSLERASAEVENNYRAFRKRQLYQQTGVTNQQPNQLPHTLRDNTLRNHLLAQFTNSENNHDVNIGLNRNAMYHIAPVHTNVTFPFPRINQNDYTSSMNVNLTNSNIANRYQVSREDYNGENYNRSNNCNVGTSTAENMNLYPSSNDNRSVDSSAIALPLHSLSISSIDISSDYLEGPDEKSPVKE